MIEAFLGGEVAEGGGNLLSNNPLVLLSYFFEFMVLDSGWGRLVACVLFGVVVVSMCGWGRLVACVLFGVVVVSRT